MAIGYLVRADYVPTTVEDQDAVTAAFAAKKAAARVAGIALLVALVNGKGQQEVTRRGEMVHALRTGADTYILGPVGRAYCIRQAAIQLHGDVDSIPPLVEAPTEPVE